MRMRFLPVFAALSMTTLAACDIPAGSQIDQGQFGGATMNNSQLMQGDISAERALGLRFASEVNPTVNFAFDSSVLTPQAQAILRQQANWIRQFPELRFRVYGFTDNVGTKEYNYQLGLRRANAVVAYFSQLGISRSRLEAIVSYGKTRPLIPVPGPEIRNRRAVTEVSGFVKAQPIPLNGKYAEIVFREYVESATRPHPQVVEIETQVDPGGN
ncbi:OmpA family protein [Neotabrizicola shimadae]|uniref:OmpA family protein n=1 Tax=Neotabrizicola shimadae TaxID=2807096 RepID=A0A8G0ZYT2_9RHOB|nr:OmpA family protein [Neotabrizicola shimadae]QYZ71677.1 OmpA family protein [Neotabrizicola shimadae]